VTNMDLKFVKIFHSPYELDTLITELDDAVRNHVKQTGCTRDPPASCDSVRNISSLMTDLIMFRDGTFVREESE
jgi:hypothetical protein